ncbi:MAG: chorismate-binding protein [Deltaproteobacteria bacterium]|nr:chorismate-binding protein [Deltaproteobacteria bacterium]
MPVVIPIKLKDGLVSAFKNLAEKKGSFILDSGDGFSKEGKYSFAGLNPLHTFSSAGGFVTIDGHTAIDNPFLSLQRFINISNGLTGDPYLPFAGGMVGFVSFEWGSAKGNMASNSNVPDVYFGMYDTVVTYDHLEGTAWVSSLGLKEDGSEDASLAKTRADELAALLYSSDNANFKSFLCYPPLYGNHPIISTLTKDKFISGFNELKGVKKLPLFAQQFVSPTHKSPWQVYLDLRSKNQATFAGYINCGDFHILSASRTCLVKVSGGNVNLRPVKGSRGKTADKDEDSKRINELVHGEEVQASHRYLVADIMKNLHGVCDSKSVSAEDVAHIESDNRAHHLVSAISGRKKSGSTALDCLLSVLPVVSDGDIAPIISRVEGAPRNVYTGTVGYIGCNGVAEFNSAYRTLVFKDTIGYLHAGTEVGLDADPEEAYINIGKAVENIFELVRQHN